MLKRFLMILLAAVALPLGAASFQYTDAVKGNVVVSQPNCAQFGLVNASTDLQTVVCTTPVVISTPPPSVTPQPLTSISCGAPFTATKVILASFGVPGTGNYYYGDVGSTFSNYGTNTIAGIYQKEAIVVPFIAPNNAKDLKIVVKETATRTGSASMILATISTKPCDFNLQSKDALIAVNDSAALVQKMNSTGEVKFSYLNLVGGNRYYLNVAHMRNGTFSCSAGRCDMYFVFDNN